MNIIGTDAPLRSLASRQLRLHLRASFNSLALSEGRTARAAPPHVGVGSGSATGWWRPVAQALPSAPTLSASAPWLSHCPPRHEGWATVDLPISLRPRPIAAAIGRPAAPARSTLRSDLAGAPVLKTKNIRGRFLSENAAHLSRCAPRSARANGARPRLKTLAMPLGRTALSRAS